MEAGQAAGRGSRFGVWASAGQSSRPSGAFRLVLVIAALRFGLSAYWAVTLPPFEAHDETGHFAYASFIAREHRLPEPGQQLTEWFDETHQPPLYYVLSALTGGAFAPAEPYTPTVNPFFMHGDRLGGANAALHDPESERFPGSLPQQFILAGRLLSAFLSAIAVLFVFLAARIIFPASYVVPLTAAGIAAFTPTWVFIGGAMTNDALVALTGTAALWAALRLIRLPTPRLFDLTIAGVALGLALLSKNNALVLVPFVSAAAGLAVFRLQGHSAAAAVRAGVGFILGAGLTAGWWYARNLVALGRPIGDRETANVILNAISPFFETVGKREPLDFVSVLVGHTFRTYWGQFGWGNVALPDSVYLAAAVVAGLAGVGMVRFLAREGGARSGFWLLVAFTLLVASLPLYRAVFFNTPTLVPGRYLLPAVGATSALLTLGLCALPGRLSVLLPGLVVASLFLVSAVTPTLVVLPEYRQPTRLTLDEVREVATPVDYTYDGRARLVGYRMSRARLRPGEEVQVTLYWHVLGTFDRPYTMGLHLVDARHVSRGATNSWPGYGNYPTSLWRPGEVFADPYRVRVPESAAGPFVAHLRPKLHDYAPIPGTTQFQYRGDLAVVDASGRPADPLLGPLAIEAPTPPAPPPVAPLATFDSAVQLDGYTLSRGPSPREIDVRLTWRALAKLDDRLVAFVHLLDDRGQIVTQSDSEPVDGLYPTIAWRQGEQVVDRHILTLAAPGPLVERLRLAIGLYRRDDLKRLPAAATSGESLPDNLLVIEARLS